MQKQDDDLSFKDLFVPFTTRKAIVFIVILGFIVFFNMLFNGFALDDLPYIINNLEIHSLNFPLLISKNTFNTVGQYRPIPALYFASLYALFTNSPFMYHFLQLCIHIINTLLVFIIFKRFFPKHLSFLLSLVFLVHPLQVESVSYIASTGNPIFFFFGISALLLSLREELDWMTSISIAFLLFMSLLTKETGVLFILLILFFRFVSKKKLPLMFIAAVSIALSSYLTLRFGIVGFKLVKSPLVAIARQPFSIVLLTIPSVVFYYLKTFFVPLRLAIDQQWVIFEKNFNSFYLPLVIDILCLLTTTLFYWHVFRRKENNRNTYYFFFVWFIIGLLFISQIVTLDATVADRWFYFPIVGILGMIGYVVNFYKHKDGVSRMTTILLIGSIVVLSIRTMERNTNWVNAMTLYTHDIKIHDNNELETNLGEEYNKKGMYNEALLHFNKAALLLPTSGAYYNIGIVNEEMGNKSKAIEAYTKALNVTEYEPKEQKRSPFIYIRLAQLLIKESKNIQAKDVIYKGLADYPSSPYLWIELTIAEYNLQNNAKALEAAENAMKLMPNDQTKALYIQLLNNQPLNVSLSL